MHLKLYLLRTSAALLGCTQATSSVCQQDIYALLAPLAAVPEAQAFCSLKYPANTKRAASTSSSTKSTASASTSSKSTSPSTSTAISVANNLRKTTTASTTKLTTVATPSTLTTATESSTNAKASLLSQLSSVADNVAKTFCSCITPTKATSTSSKSTSTTSSNTNPSTTSSTTSSSTESVTTYSSTSSNTTTSTTLGNATSSSTTTSSAGPRKTCVASNQAICDSGSGCGCGVGNQVSIDFCYKRTGCRASASADTPECTTAADCDYLGEGTGYAAYSYLCVYSNTCPGGTMCAESGSASTVNGLSQPAECSTAEHGATARRGLEKVLDRV